MVYDLKPIVAIATASGLGGIGIVRLSGKNVGLISEIICGQSLVLLNPRKATFLSFKQADGSLIDQGLVIYFQAPHSYTGEDILEFQGHGGSVVLQILLARCLEAGTKIGLRLAMPGEFTQRAFLNDKLDLAQAEAVIDLIEASTEAAARSAAISLSGVFSNVIDDLLNRIINLRVLVEANLDFPEEETHSVTESEICSQLVQIRTDLNKVFMLSSQGSLLRDGLNTVLIGKPNVGKSSLLNILAGADVAIVTSIAGTTRDKITEPIQIQGVLFNIIDTAGIRHINNQHEKELDEVEQIGIQRTWNEVSRADIILYILDINQKQELEDKMFVKNLPDGIPMIYVWNKIDCIGRIAAIDTIQDTTHIYLSVINQQGINLLRAELLRIAGWRQTVESPYLARKRHLLILKSVLHHLNSAVFHISNNQIQDKSLDIFAEELRLAQEKIACITGKFTSNDLLDVIFSQFCIGK